MKIMRGKTLNKMLKEHANYWTNLGFQYGMNYREMLENGRGFIQGSKADKEIDAILKEKGVL